MHNLNGQEMNVKKLCRKEKNATVEKTTVDFVSVASSIYHCFFFLDLPLVMSDVDPVSDFPGFTVCGGLLWLLI